MVYPRALYLQHTSIKQIAKIEYISLMVPSVLDFGQFSCIREHQTPLVFAVVFFLFVDYCHIIRRPQLLSQDLWRDSHRDLWCMSNENVYRLSQDSSQGRVVSVRINCWAILSRAQHFLWAIKFYFEIKLQLTGSTSQKNRIVAACSHIQKHLLGNSFPDYKTPTHVNTY